MKSISLIGSMIVTLALISYSIGIITEQRKKLITKRVLSFISIGIVLDITATFCMIIGSSNGPFTFHGFIGYTALALMMIDTILIWKHHFKNSIDTVVPKFLHVYSRYAYIYWVLAYITGGLLVAMK